jgi:hypothetical protein
MIKKLAYAISASVVILYAQQQTITLSTPTPTGVVQGNASVVGNAGITTYNYWIIARYPRGNANHSPRIETIKAPNTLSGGNYVRLDWAPAANATGYDVIKSTSNTFPTTGNILLASNISTTTFNDQGQALSSYTVSTIPLVSETWYLDNTSCATPTLFAPSITGSATLTCNPSTYLRPSNNLSDLTNITTARTNLGLTSTATTALTSLLQSANNLSDLASSATARTNLGITQSWIGANLLGSTVTGIANNNSIPFGSAGALTSNANFTYDAKDFRALHMASSSAQPTFVAGGGAGTGPTITVVGTDQSMSISLTTGTSPTPSTNAVVVTFGTVFTNLPSCIVTLGATYAYATAGSHLYIIPTFTGYSFGLMNGAFLASTPYKFNVICLDQGR